MHVIKKKIICKRDPLWSWKLRAATAKHHEVCAAWGGGVCCPAWLHPTVLTMEPTAKLSLTSQVQNRTLPYSHMKSAHATLHFQHQNKTQPNRLKQPGIQSCVRLLQAAYTSLASALCCYVFIMGFFHNTTSRKSKWFSIFTWHTSWGMSLFNALHF